MNGEILAFIVYFVAIVGVGIYFFFKEKGDATQANFFLGGRQMGPWVAAMSAQASDMSAWLVNGSSGKYSGVWIRSDVDRYRTGSGNCSQLDLRCQEIEEILQCGWRCYHSTAVSGQ